MKTAIIIFAICFTVLNPYDWALHIVVSAGITYGVHTAFIANGFSNIGATTIAVPATFAIGFIKEMIDPCFSWRDIFYNCVGITVVIPIIYF